MKKKAVLVVFVLVVILCLAMPVVADGNIFSKLFGWFRYFFAGGPSGAQTFEIGELVISPSSLAQGAVAPVTLYGDFVNETVSVSPEIDVLNQTLTAEGILVWLRVSVFAPVGSYNISVGSDSFEFYVTEGPLDYGSINYTQTVVFNSTVGISVNVSVAPYINKAQVSISDGSLTLIDDETNASFVLDLVDVSDSDDMFVLSFGEHTFTDAALYRPVLKLSLNFAESFSPTVQFDEEFVLPFDIGVQTYPLLCLNIVPFSVIGAPYCCPPITGFPPSCGYDNVVHFADPGAGTAAAIPYCKAGGGLCAITYPPFIVLPLVMVCDMDYAGLPGAPCSLSPTSACLPPYSPGRCMPAQYICGGPLGGAYPMYAAFPVPPSPFPLGTPTCSSPAINLCGNGILEGPPLAGPEYCDAGVFPPVDCDASVPGGCDADCTPVECGDFTVCGGAPWFEACDPPGNTFQCAGGLACTSTCTCPPVSLPPGGGNSGGDYVNTQCYPLQNVCDSIDALNNGEISPVDFRSWAAAMVAPNGKVMPSVSDTKFPSFEACWQHNVGMNMFASPSQYLDAFTIVGVDGIRRWTNLPEGYPAEDAAKFYEKQTAFKNKLGDRKEQFGVSDEPADLCQPSGPHITAVSQAKCQVSNNDVSVFWTRGWTHNWRQEIDMIDFLSTGHVMSGEGVDVSLLAAPGSRADLQIHEIGGGVVDGRTDKCKSDDRECFQVVKKQFKSVPEWSITFKSVATDSQQKKDIQQAVLTSADCVSCPLFITIEGREYPNPCCDPGSVVPSACCDSKKYFLQGKTLARSAGQCYSVSTVLDGPKKNVCLIGMNSCDISSPGFVFDKSRGLYNQFDWVPVGKDCSKPFNPITQSFSGSAFKEAVEVCPPVPRCKEGEIKRTGENIGLCRQRVEECKNSVWVVVEPGVARRFEFCNGEDDDCNNQVDDILLCECPGSRATQPCFDDRSTPVQTCENRRGHYFWNRVNCVEPPKKVAPVKAAEIAQDQFAVQTVEGFGVPCGDNDFSCCIVFNKQTDGDVVFEETSSVIPPGYVPIGSYKIDNCEGGDVDVAMNIKPVESAVAAFKRAGKEQKLPVGLKTSLDCAGLDFQSLSDQSVIPEISLQEISEGLVLSADSKVLSALDVKIEFAGDVDGVQVDLKNADVKFRNKALVTVGAPMELSFEPRPGINVRISAPLVLKARVDANSLGFYVLQNGEWKYLGGAIENGMFVIQLDDIAQYQPFIFMVAGSKCAGCEQAYLSVVRDVNSPVLVVLVHGFLSAPDLAWSAFLKQFRDEEVKVDVAVFGYQGMAPDDAVKVLSERLQVIGKDYDKIVFISHSLGGLIVQKFLLGEPALLQKVDAVITAGTPFLGTPLAGTAENVFDLFAVLLDNVDYAPMFGIRPETLELLKSGVPDAFPSGIKVFSLVGTSDFLGLGTAFGLAEPNDAMVEAKSATNDGSFSKVCVDVLEHEQNHFYLNRAADERYTLLYFLRQLSSEFNVRAPSQMYAALRISNCQPGEIILYGKPINPKELPPPMGCEGTTCGDGVCQTTENMNICERDCSPPRKEMALNVCGISFWSVNVLLLLNILLICAYAITKRRLLVFVYVLSVLALIGFIGNFFLCSSIPIIPLIVFGIMLLILVIDYYVKFVPRYYKWH